MYYHIKNTFDNKPSQSQNLSYLSFFWLPLPCHFHKQVTIYYYYYLYYILIYILIYNILTKSLYDDRVKKNWDNWDSEIETALERPFCVKICIYNTFLHSFTSIENRRKRQYFQFKTYFQETQNYKMLFLTSESPIR